MSTEVSEKNDKRATSSKINDRGQVRKPLSGFDTR